MAPIQIVRRFRQLDRLGEIMRVLARHGFAHLVQRIGLRHRLPLRWRVPEPPAAGSDAARHAVAAIQELGPTFVKLGQMLATRPDIVPPEWMAELTSLHDHVAPFETDLAVAVIADECGAPVDEVFAEFDRTPFAAGSMAQCYRAVSRDGRPVVVKVKRPGIERTMLRDLDLLGSLARLIERHAPEYRVYRPVMIVEELARTTMRELDFIGEASNTERFGRDFEKMENVGVARVDWDTTTSSVLTLERMDGENLQALLDRGDERVDRKALAGVIVQAFMRQFFETGFFHADPHPGNLLVVAPARLNLLDFGMVGHLTDEMKGHLATLVLGMVARDLDVLVDVMLEVDAIGPETRIETLKADLLAGMDKYFSLPSGRVDMAQVFAEFTEALRRNNVILPPEVVMLSRSFVTVSSLAMRLDPELRLGDVVKPYARRLILEKVSPSRLGRGLLVSLWQLGGLLSRAPRDVRDLLRRARRGELQLTLEHRRLDDFMGEIDRAGNRLAFAVTIAAVVISSSMVLKLDVGPKLFNVSAFGLIGYVIAGLLGVWLLVAILRSGRL